MWVDTDFGFDDLWAMLLLRHLNSPVDGVSLVAGNVPLPQVIKNAKASCRAFDFDWPVLAGANKPLKREPETAERILGKSGMPSRGLQLPECRPDLSEPVDALNGGQSSAVTAMATWLSDAEQPQLLALGPLTNIALLLEHHPEVARRITKLTWMGGSAGHGNHSPFAEYNAIADPEALAVVATSGVPFRMIDLELCRQVTFTEDDMPELHGKNRQLLRDLLGGYLDIALSRGRKSMAIYDPLAALATGTSELFDFVPVSLDVHTNPDSRYGQTIFRSPEHHTLNDSTGACEYATAIDSSTARTLCLAALHNA